MLLSTNLIQIPPIVPLMSLIVKENPELCITFSCIVSLVSFILDQFLCISFSFMIIFQRVQGSQFVEYPSFGVCWMLPHDYFQKSLVGRIPPDVSLSRCYW